MKTIRRTIVSALIFSKDGKLLMGMKDPKSGGVYADCWHIPGGGVDEGETKEQALRREMLEEVGIDIAKCKVTLADDDTYDCIIQSGFRHQDYSQYLSSVVGYLRLPLLFYESNTKVQCSVTDHLFLRIFRAHISNGILIWAPALNA